MQQGDDGKGAAADDAKQPGDDAKEATADDATKEDEPDAKRQATEAAKADLAADAPIGGGPKPSNVIEEGRIYFIYRCTCGVLHTKGNRSLAPRSRSGANTWRRMQAERWWQGPPCSLLARIRRCRAHSLSMRHNYKGVWLTACLH